MVSVKSVDNKRNKYPVRLHINGTAVALSISTAKRLVDEFCDAILCAECSIAKSDTAEAVEQPLTQQGSTLSQIAAAEKLCELYFEIAASCIGEEEVRKRVAAATSAVA